MKLLKVLIIILALKGSLSFYEDFSLNKSYKIRSYDSLIIINKQLHKEFLKANTQLSEINNNFLYQHYMKNVDIKNIQTNYGTENY